MTTAEAIEIAIEAIRARQSRMASMDRFYSRSDSAHERYLERDARHARAIEVLTALSEMVTELAGSSVKVAS